MPRDRMPNCRWFYLFLCLALMHPVSAYSAKRLDIYNSAHPFPTQFLSNEGVRIDLGKIDEKAIPGVLKNYLQAQKRVQTTQERNLLALALGFLYLQKGEYHAALTQFKSRIVGNFILQDFHLKFKAHALKELALQKFNQKKYSHALRRLKESSKVMLNLYNHYPDSLLHADVPQFLAETEVMMGDAYVQLLNYKAAWLAYRRALMRDFPDNKEHRIQVSLSLAKTYEYAGQVEEAADIYIYLIENFKSPETAGALIQFAQKFVKALRKKNIDFEKYLPVNSEAQNFNNSNTKQTASKVVNGTAYENELVLNFYESLNQGEISMSLQLGFEVLSQFPGKRESRKVVTEIQDLIVGYLSKNPWNQMIDKITDLYPAYSLNKMAHRLWKKNLPEKAVNFYKKILKNFPLEIQACHKAVFFLGRIFEDRGEASQAIKYYNLLLNKYDFGPYTLSAMFKIPWIERLDGKHPLAKIHFERILNFHSSGGYEELKKNFPNSSFYLTAARFWLAQTEGALGNWDKKASELNHLINNYPFDFYSILSRGKLNLKEYLNADTPQEIVYRKFGLGELERKRLSRAEKLIAVGFLDYGKRELAQLTSVKGDPAFSYYLSRLFNQARDFQNSIRLSWKVNKARNKNTSLSKELAQSLFPRGYLNKVDTVARLYNLDPLLILSLMRQESAFNENIVSSAKAVGLMQLMPETAASVARSMRRPPPEPQELTDPETNIQLGVDYLNYLISRFQQNVVYALAAYNAGPRKTEEWVALRSHLSPLEFMESIPYQETRNYVKKILRNYAIYLSLYRDDKMSKIKEILTLASD